MYSEEHMCVKLFNDYYGSVYAYMQIYTYIHTYIHTVQWVTLRNFIREMWFFDCSYLCTGYTVHVYNDHMLTVR